MSSPLLWGPNNTSNNLQNKIKLATGSTLGIGIDAWAASTAYIVNDLVTYGQVIYSCLIAHTSSSSMQTDLAGTSPKWVIVNKQPLSQNLMTFGADFESGDTSGWSACGCATVTNGLLASVGSGGAIFSSSNGGRTKGANTTSPAVVSSGQLDGSYSLNFATSGAGTIGDMYISSAYKIPIAFQSTVLQVKFKYKVVSGAPVMAGTSSNTYACAIYDVDNNSWMPLVGAFNFVQSSGVGTFTGTTQVPYNSTQFQIAIYNPIAPTGASSLYVDDFYVGPQITATGPAMSDLKAYTPTLTNFGNGTAALSYKQEGNLCKIKGILLVGSTVPTGQIKFTLPSGLSADFAYLTKGLTGIDAFQKVGSATSYAPGFYSAAIIRDNTSLTTFYFNGEASAYGGNTDWSNIAPVTWTASDVITIDMEVPIAGWSSNSVMSADTDTKVISMNVNTATATITSSYSDVTFTNKYSDKNSIFGTTTATMPVSGSYDFSISLGINITASAGITTVALVKNGTVIYDNFIISTTSTGIYLNPTLNLKGIPCLAGDLLKVQIKSTATSPTMNGVSTENYFSLSRLSGPAVIAATESVTAGYTFIYASAIPTGSVTTLSNTYVTYTKGWDSHNAFSSGVYTCPVSGKYDVSTLTEFAASGVGNARAICVAQGGSKTLTRYIDYINVPTTGVSILCKGVATFDCLAGDTLSFQALQSSGSTMHVADSGASYNHVEIKRIGN